jgi:hypothetical protein
MSSQITRTVRDLIIIPRSPLRSVAALVIGIVSLIPPLLCFGACGYEALRAKPSLVLYPLGLLVVIASVPALNRRILAWHHRRALRADLAQRLLEAGFAEQDEAPGARQLRADFWEREQRGALEQLRGQLATHAHSEDLFVAMRRAASQSKLFIAILAAVWGVVTFVLSKEVSIPLVFSDQVVFCLVSAVYFVLAMSYLFSLSGLVNLAKEHAERRQLLRETHRVVNLIETAGGLSLAEGEMREILQGAIEPAGAVGGELTMRAPGEGP